MHTVWAAASKDQPCLHKDNGDPWKTPNQQQNLEEIEGKEIKQEIPPLKIVGCAAVKYDKIKNVCVCVCERAVGNNPLWHPRVVWLCVRGDEQHVCFPPYEDDRQK